MPEYLIGYFTKYGDGASDHTKFYEVQRLGSKIPNKIVTIHLYHIYGKISQCLNEYGR